MNVVLRFTLSLGLIVLSTLAGYLARRKGLAGGEVARRVMTLVTVAGYPVVGFMAIWRISLEWSNAWLPVLGALQTTLMALIALAAGRRLLSDRAECGMVGICCGVGNHGVTMAGFVVYLLLGNIGLGLNTVYATYTFFALVLLSYTIAQAYAPDVPRQSIVSLMANNLLNWRAAGLYACVVAVLFTAFGVPVPAVIDTWRLLDIAIYAVIVLAYFSIGVRLHLPHVLEMKRAIILTLVVRHAVGLLIGLALVGVTFLTPWPLKGVALKVFLIQSSVSVGVFGVAVANMFHIKPREASALFIVSSTVYLVVGVPLILLVFRYL